MPTIVDTEVSKPARITGRVMSGVVVLFLLFDGAIKLVPLSVVTETMDRMGFGASDALARSLGIITIVCTLLYSVPPFRTKRLGIWANVTIAIPRGVLLKVAGWSSVKTILGVEPWYIGAIFGLFLLGATTTKDFADMEGDRRGGCRTLPIQFGVRRAAWMISPSFVVPFLMIPIGAWLHVLTGNFWLLQILGGVMTVYGVYVCYLMLRRPEDLAVEENHVSWAHMYRMMFVAQIGFALAYLL